MKEAMYYRKLEDKRVLCYLCPHNCNLPSGVRGRCRVRENHEGVLYTLNYNRISSLALDNIEKKPLYHFYSGFKVLSAGTVGCNLRCSFCQNWNIAQNDAGTKHIDSETLVSLAKGQHKNIGIAYTYNEPSIWFEFVYETAKLAKKSGLKNILVTNGFIGEEPLKSILPYVDAMNIDVKGFTEKYYRDICKGLLEPVKRTVEIASTMCHVEITTLVVTDLNDSIKEIKELTLWLSSINKNIPLHLSRYFPNYELHNNPTPLSILYKAKDEAEKNLNFVYVGNVHGNDNNTYCPNCRKPIIIREDSIIVEGLEDGGCKYCKEKLSIIYR